MKFSKLKGNREKAIGNRQQAIGNRQKVIGNRQQAIEFCEKQGANLRKTDLIKV
jgi:hypothetical protein